MVKRSAGELLFGIQVDRASSVSITQQVYAAIRRLITSGALPVRRRLPSSRTLAKELDISRTTALAVFARLASEGLIEARTGSGSFVSPEAAGRKPVAPPVPSASSDSSQRLADLIAAASPRFFRRLPHPQQPRAFVTGLPDYAAFPLAIWAKLSAKHWRRPRAEIMSYSDPDGFGPLREAIADHLRANRGIQCESDEIFIVNGAQQAFDLIGRMVLNPGDAVWFENPGAIGARNSLIACGAAMSPVPVDEEGLSVTEGVKRAPDFRLAFVTPSHQHPTGVEMSLKRRGELLAAADAADAWIIEDDYDGEFRFDGRPLPTLKSIDRAERVFYVGTFSKTMFPALRLGFYIAPKPLAPIFRRAAGAFLQGVPLSVQAATAAFIEEGHFVTHLRRMREIYAARHAAFHDAEAALLGGLVTTCRSGAGFHILARFVDPLSDEDAIQAAAEAAGLLVSPIGRFCLDPVPAKGLVLGVSAIDPGTIRRGVETLAGVFERARKSALGALRRDANAAGFGTIGVAQSPDLSPSQRP
jgi:GntR family transcriptional regulator / MocR family aminotransferase